MAMTQRQSRFLMERLAELRRSKPYRHGSTGDLPVPKRVKEAQAAIARLSTVVNAHNKRVSAQQTKRADAAQAAYSECQKAILFGDADKAVKAVDAYEKKKF